MDSVDDIDQYNASPILYLSEEARAGDKGSIKIVISLISVCPATGDVLWDQFEGMLTLRNSEFGF